MLDTIADTWYTWLGLVAASLALMGVVVALPAGAPPAADPVERTVESVAASPYEERERVALSAPKVRLSSRGVTLRSEGGVAHAAFDEPVTPVLDGRLGRVLRGTPPRVVYDTPAAFAAALRAARNRESRWRRAPESFAVRRVTWGDVDATLVG